MFKTRLLSGIVLVIAALVLIITGGDVLLISTLIISYIGMFELYRIFHIEKEAVGIIGYLAATVYYCNLKFAFLPDTMVFVLGVLILMMFAYVFTYPKYKTEQVLAAFFGVFYVAVMLSYVYQTRMIEAGAYIVWLVFLCSWGCDTCAYCVGMLIGKHKMSPKLSPKKSVEGAVGGVAGAALLTIIYGMIFKSAMQIDQTHVWIMAGISAVGALISMVGDLTASAIKRNYEIKDYGKLIPGHGGILDRFDSVIFPALIAAIVGLIPSIPTIAVTKISLSGITDTSRSPSMPDTIFMPRSFVFVRSSDAFFSSHTLTSDGLNSLICASNKLILLPAAIATT